MAVKKRGLGRGLDALLSGPTVSALEEQAVKIDQKELQHLPLELIQRGKYQPRRDMDPQALEELAHSIKAQGVMQPIVVRPIGDNRYEIIAGERRWRASQQAGLDTIPAMVRDVPDEAAIAMALIENIQREDLNPLEEAIALQRLQQEFQLTQQQVADAVGKSRVTVANLLRLISLPEVIKTMLAHGDLEMGHARALLGLTKIVRLKGRDMLSHVASPCAKPRHWFASGSVANLIRSNRANLIRISLASNSVWPSAWALRCRSAMARRAKASWSFGYNSLMSARCARSHPLKHFLL
jgi:ParB family chromosome partitioning protein